MYHLSIKNQRECFCCSTIHIGKSTLRFPEPSATFRLGRCHIENDTVSVQTFDAELDEDKDEYKTEVERSFEWKLDLPPVIMNAVNQLLAIAFHGCGENPLVDIFSAETAPNEFGFKVRSKTGEMCITNTTGLLKRSLKRVSH